MTGTTYLTQSELDALQASLNRKAPFVITGVSHGYFSVARHYGGARYNGASYTYHPATDELIRNDVLKWVEKRRRAARKSGKNEGQEVLT